MYDKFKQENYFKTKGKLRKIRNILNSLSGDMDLFSDRINKINQTIDTIWNGIGERTILNKDETEYVDLKLVSSRYEYSYGYIEFTIIIQNIGNTNSKACKLKTTFDNTSIENNIPILASEESCIINVGFYYDMTITEKHNVNIVADYYRTNKDANFSNNKDNYFITMDEFAPILTIETYSGTISSSYISFDVTIKNTGNIISGYTTLTCKLSDEIKTYTIIPLAIDETVIININFIPPVVETDTNIELDFTTISDSKNILISLNPSVLIEEPATPGAINLYMHLHNNENQEIGSIIYNYLIKIGYTSEQAVEYIRNTIGYIIVEYDGNSFVLDFSTGTYALSYLFVETSLITVTYHYFGNDYAYMINNPSLGNSYHIEHLIPRTYDYNLEDINNLFNEYKKGTFNIVKNISQNISKNLELSTESEEAIVGNYEYKYDNGLTYWNHDQIGCNFITEDDKGEDISWDLSEWTGAYLSAHSVDNPILAIKYSEVIVPLGKNMGGSILIPMVLGLYSKLLYYYDSGIYTELKDYNQLSFFHLTDSPYEIIGNTTIERFE